MAQVLRLLGFLSLLVLVGASSPLLGSPEGVQISNWPAPPYWTPTAVRAPGEARTDSAITASTPLPFVALTPCRVADTRGNGFAGQYGPPSLTANATRSFTITGQCGVPATAAAVSFNFAALNVAARAETCVSSRPEEASPWSRRSTTTPARPTSPTPRSCLWAPEARSRSRPTRRQSLLKPDGAGAILQTVTVGGHPGFPAFDGTNIRVPTGSLNSVSVVRASTGDVVATLTGNGLNDAKTAAFDGTRVLVTNAAAGANSVSLWKASDFTPLGSSGTGTNSTPGRLQRRPQLLGHARVFRGSAREVLRPRIQSVGSASSVAAHLRRRTARSRVRSSGLWIRSEGSSQATSSRE